MSNPWFRMYAEFAHDPKVQMMTEAMQRRYMMVMCMRCSNALVTLHETEIAFHLRISDVELAQTKALFVAKGFIDEAWNLLNWEKRQFVSDTSKDRVAKHRALQKEKQASDGNADVTLRKRNDNALDTDTDTDTEKKEVAKATLSPAKLTTLNCPTEKIIEIYHEVLPELPACRLKTATRDRAAKSRWQWVLTSKKSDGTRRAESANDALDWFKNYFLRARDNDFLMGRTQRGGSHENWQCDFDFLLTDKGLKQVVEKTKETA